jgi:hypothetical protein
MTDPGITLGLGPTRLHWQSQMTDPGITLGLGPTRLHWHSQMTDLGITHLGLGPTCYHNDGFIFNVSEDNPSEPVGVTTTNSILFDDVLLINNSIELSNATLSFGKQSLIFDRGINIVDGGRFLNIITTTHDWGDLCCNITIQPSPISTGGLHPIITLRSVSFLRFGDRTPLPYGETYVFNSSDRISIYEVHRLQWLLIMGTATIRLLLSPRDAQHHRIHATTLIRLTLRYKFYDAEWGGLWNQHDVGPTRLHWQSLMMPLVSPIGFGPTRLHWQSLMTDPGITHLGFAAQLTSTGTGNL